MTLGRTIKVFIGAIEMMASVNSIEKLLVAELKDLYSAEHQITKALPKLVEATSSADLRTAFEHHLKETENQIRRLEDAFKLLGVTPRKKTCHGMEGILSEGSEMLHETEPGEIRDVALISAAQRVEHYEMAAYGTVRSYAQQLNRPEIAGLLQETLEEEKNADRTLTEISHKVNRTAPRAA
jgi:ferritin-like metal-binding protein YciE